MGSVTVLYIVYMSLYILVVYTWCVHVLYTPYVYKGIYFCICVVYMGIYKEYIKRYSHMFT